MVPFFIKVTSFETWVFFSEGGLEAEVSTEDIFT